MYRWNIHNLNLHNLNTIYKHAHTYVNTRMYNANIFLMFSS